VSDSRAFLGTETVILTLVTIEILQWTPFALLILYTAYREIPSHL
jgi:multiple sugar transport system permease protein